jgi:hypothetical protein
MKRLLVAGVIITINCQLAAAENCIVAARGSFSPQKKTILLLKSDDKSNIVYFRTRLRVNTDGAPNSYHPFDPRGTTKAINNIANAIAISHNGKGLSYNDTIKVFENWRDSGWQPQAGYKISWQDVLAARRDPQGRDVPCTFSQGAFSGYFVSLTALKNKLPATEAGECGANDQLDERNIPALVLAGGRTPMSQWGVRTGDLVVARNASNNAVVAAVVGDIGPPDNLGEGSVALNMALLQRQDQPRNYSEAKRLDTGNNEIEIAIFPGTASYQWASPISADNIRSRVDQWIQAHAMPKASEVPSWLDVCTR